MARKRRCDRGRRRFHATTSRLLASSEHVGGYGGAQAVEQRPGEPVKLPGTCMGHGRARLALDRGANDPDASRSLMDAAVHWLRAGYVRHEHGAPTAQPSARRLRAATEEKATRDKAAAQKTARMATTRAADTAWVRARWGQARRQTQHAGGPCACRVACVVRSRDCKPQAVGYARRVKAAHQRASVHEVRDAWLLRAGCPWPGCSMRCSCLGDCGASVPCGTWAART